MSITLVAALGNPGREYENTRHNLGWFAIDAYASKHGLAWRNESQFDSLVARAELGPEKAIWFAKPQTYMNESGRAIGALARYYRISSPSIAAVYDDLAIDLGLLKVTVGGGDAGHNGIASLVEHLGPGFCRYRLGTGPKDPPEMDIKDFVLARFSPDQLTLIQQKTTTYILGLELLIASGPDRAMNQLNRRDPP